MTPKKAKYLIAATGLQNIEPPELQAEALACVNAALDKQIETEPSAYEYRIRKYAYICLCGQALKWFDTGVTELCL